MVHSLVLALTRLELLRVRTFGAFVTATNNGPEVGWLCGRREGGETKPGSGDSHGYNRQQK